MVLSELVALDTAVIEFIAAVKTGLITEFFTAVTAFGSVTVAAILILGLWVYDQRQTAILSGISVFIAGSTTRVLKEVVARSRPETVAEFLLYNVDSYAFPSGHTTLAFAMAVILADKAEKPAVRVYLYSLAVLVAMSRVYLGVHYVSDVVAGAVVGYVAALIVLRFEGHILRYTDRVTG